MSLSSEEKTVYNKQHYIKNKLRYKQNQIKCKQRCRLYILSIKQKSKCYVCGDDRPPVLCFHHRDKNTKQIDPSTMVANKWSIKKIDEEIKKCDIMCHNCHQQLHWEELHPDNLDGRKLI